MRSYSKRHRYHLTCYRGVLLCLLQRLSHVYLYLYQCWYNLCEIQHIHTVYLSLHKSDTINLQPTGFWNAFNSFPLKAFHCVFLIFHLCVSAKCELLTHIRIKYIILLLPRRLVCWSVYWQEMSRAEEQLSNGIWWTDWTDWLDSGSHLSVGFPPFRELPFSSRNYETNRSRLDSKSEEYVKSAQVER